MAAQNEFSLPQPLRLIGLPDAPALVDTYIIPDFAEDPHLIPGSFRHPHTDIVALYRWARDGAGEGHDWLAGWAS